MAKNLFVPLPGTVFLCWLVVICCAGESTGSDRLCGYRSALFVLRSTGRAHTPEAVLSSFPPNIAEAGCSQQEVADVLRKFGLTANCEVLPFLAVSRLGLPTIVHLRDRQTSGIGHFVVFLGLTPLGRVQCWDGDFGIVHTPKATFEAQFSGACVTLNSDIGPRRQGFTHLLAIVLGIVAALLVSAVGLRRFMPLRVLSKRRLFQP